MDIAIVGAGPAGLYAAILLKRARPDARVRVFEKNSQEATFGFGVVFSDQALAFLREDDPHTADLIEPAMERWSDIVVAHAGEAIAIDGVGFHAIGRLELLELLRERAVALGVSLSYGHGIRSVDELDGATLVIGADGLNSLVRAEDPDAYGETRSELRNHFVWYGATRPFDALTQTFKNTPLGAFNAHHYRYSPQMSTFIIECGPKTFARVGFGNMSEPDRRAVCEDIFADELAGALLVPNQSIWRRFPVLRCARWFHGNRVLVGDALHTAHFSIGSGTRLALEDVIALVRALTDCDFNLDAALPAYQAARAPVLEKILRAAASSATWYEAFDRHMALEPWPFALSYIRRAARLDGRRLTRLAPVFAEALRSRGIDLDAPS